MAVNHFDPVTGRPIFADTDPPDIKVDPTAVGEFAADTGNRIVRASLSELDAYPYIQTGLAGHALDSGIEYVHDGTGWAVLGGITPATVIPTLAAGWSAPSVSSVRRVGQFATLTFNAFRSTDSVVDGPVVTIPAGFRAGRNVYGFGWGLSGAAAAIQAIYDAATHTVRLRQTISSGQALALTLTWPVA